MDLEMIILSEVSQAETDKYHISRMCNLKNDTNELIYKTETDRHRKQTLWVTKKKGDGETN